MGRHDDSNNPQYAVATTVTGASLTWIGPPVNVLGATGISFTTKGATGTLGTTPVYKIYLSDFGAGGGTYPQDLPVDATDWVDSGVTGVTVSTSAPQRIGCQLNADKSAKWARLAVTSGDVTTALTGINAAVTVRRYPED